MLYINVFVVPSSVHTFRQRGWWGIVFSKVARIGDSALSMFITEHLYNQQLGESNEGHRLAVHTKDFQSMIYYMRLYSIEKRGVIAFISQFYYAFEITLH